MNITFLIGNGFDLNLNLNTNYDDFLKKYKVVLLEDSKCLKFFKEDILSNEELWAKAEEAFGVATKQFKKHGYTAEDFCECHEDFCIKLAEYLLNQEKRLNYAALNNAIAQGFAKSILKYKEGFRETEIDQIGSAEQTIGGGLVFNFINFNYTQTLDKCAYTIHKNGALGKRSYQNTAYDNRIGKILHVHGTTEKDMVLGVNDISQISDTSLFDGWDEEFINEIIKQRTNEINEENTDKKVLDLLTASNLIYIYGMSIGTTDKLWWERICTLMHQNKKLHLIIHKFNAPEDGLIRRSFRIFSNNARKDFTKYCDFEEGEKTEIEKRIHIDRTNIFEELKGLVNSEVNHMEKEPIAI